MSYNNKKGSVIGTFGKIVVLFNIITWLFLFIFQLYTDIGDDYIIAEGYNITLDLLNSGEINVSPEMITFLEDTRDEYYETDLPLDLFFLGFFMNLFLVTSFMAFMGRKKGIYTFMGAATWGTMIFLFVLTFIDQIVVWLFDNAYTNLFNLDRAGTPIAFWFIDNNNAIAFFWFIWLLAINQFDFEWVMGKLKLEGGFQK